MNLIESQIPNMVEAKVVGGNTEEKSISYNFAEQGHILCLKKMEIIEAQIHACEILLEDIKDEAADLVIKSEIVDLTVALTEIKSNKNSKFTYCSSNGCENKAIIICSVCFDFYSCGYKHACLHKHPMDEFKVLG